MRQLLRAFFHKLPMPWYNAMLRETVRGRPLMARPAAKTKPANALFVSSLADFPHLQQSPDLSRTSTVVTFKGRGVFLRPS